MPVTDAARHHLLDALTRAIGEEAAMTLADHLPPVGWADVATRRDLDALRSEILGALHQEIGAVHREIATFHRDMAASQRQWFFAVLGALVANTGLVVAISRSIGST